MSEKRQNDKRLTWIELHGRLHYDQQFINLKECYAIDVNVAIIDDRLLVLKYNIRCV